jgi:hypothetical protein
MATAGGRSVGHQQALEQLGQVAAESAGAVEILRVEPLDGVGWLAVELSLDCTGVAQGPGGLRLRPRERVTVQIPADFPFRLPGAAVPHRRFAGAPHVQWGRQLCLYQAPTTEWAPADGMFGFLERLMEWYERAAAGALDAPGQPLHPPVAYPSREAGCLVVHADAPRAAGSPRLGVAVLRQAEQARVDVIGWLELGDAWPVDAPAAQELADRLHPVTGRAGGPGVVFLAVTVVLPEPITFEFPSTAAALAHAMAAQGLPSEFFLGLLGLVAQANEPLADQLLATSQTDSDLVNGDDPDGQDARLALPLYALVGCPARGVAGSPNGLPIWPHGGCPTWVNRSCPCCRCATRLILIWPALASGSSSWPETGSGWRRRRGRRCTSSGPSWSRAATRPARPPGCRTAGC